MLKIDQKGDQKGIKMGPKGGRLILNDTFCAIFSTSVFCIFSHDFCLLYITHRYRNRTSLQKLVNDVLLYV